MHYYGSLGLPEIGENEQTDALPAGLLLLALLLLENRLLQAHHQRGDLIVGRLAVANHVVPAGEDFKAKGGLVVLAAHSAHAGVLRHSRKGGNYKCLSLNCNKRLIIIKAALFAYFLSTQKKLNMYRQREVRK